MKIVVLLLSLVIASVSYADDQEGIYVSAEEAKNINLMEIAGTYSNRLGFEMTIKVKKEEIAEDLFSKKGYYVLISEYEELFTKVPADLNLYPEPRNDMRGITVSENGVIEMGYSNQDCDNPGCSNVELNLTLKKNKKGKYYAEIAWMVETHEEELDFDFEDMDPETASESMNEYCMAKYTSKVTTSIYSEFNSDWSYCYHDYEVFLSKKK